jgi:hypothetical protein
MFISTGLLCRRAVPARRFALRTLKFAAALFMIAGSTRRGPE